MGARGGCDEVEEVMRMAVEEKMMQVAVGVYEGSTHSWRMGAGVSPEEQHAPLHMMQKVLLLHHGPNIPPLCHILLRDPANTFKKEAL
jgi:hypothetical protein